MAERTNLCTLVLRAEANGNAHMIVAVPRKRAPGTTMQLMPGLPARCVGWDGERAIVDVRVTDVRRWMDRRGIDPSDPKWSTAPAGDDARDGGA